MNKIIKLTDTEYRVFFGKDMGLPEMKIFKRISLFLLTSSIMFGAGSYFTLKAEQFFYPNKYATLEKESHTESLLEVEAEEKADKETIDSTTDESELPEADLGDTRVIEAAAEDISVITADTVYLVGEVNLSNGKIEEKEEDIPVKYIGLDRIALIAELEEYNKNPPLSELKLGFTNIELTAFSKDQVVVCKYYDTDGEEEGFYLMVADHFVVVYKQDKQTIYMTTDILLDSLSTELQEEIMEGKYIEDEQELYNFLESYSS